LHQFLKKLTKGLHHMPTDIRIKKGLDINLVGAAQKETNVLKDSDSYQINLDDFHGIVPKLLLKQGEKVKAGQGLFFNKDNEEMLFVSPVSGVIDEIKRGARRRVLTITIKADGTDSTEKLQTVNLENDSADQIKKALLAGGCWPFIKQRPYDIIANPADTPKGIFISGLDTAPLAADLDYTLAGSEKYLQAAVTALGKLTSGSVHISVKGSSSVLAGLEGVQLHTVSGPHPAGLVGTLINKVDPINKGERVWTVNAADLEIIGKLLLEGEFDGSRTIAVAGSGVSKPSYVRVKLGAEIKTVLDAAGGLTDENVRVINGNVLTGTGVASFRYLRFYNNSVTVIPEGNDYELFGWAKPVSNKVSITRALTLSWLNKRKKYNLNTNTNGEHRAFVLTGQYEQVFPLDIYPMQLLKSCMIKDLDEMEQLGLYEVAPEDFALTEFVCVSKQPHQKIIREALDLLHKEIG
jgi:Na+-transporting NADH:ubiquinone oxidoreductase subunit A